MEGEPSELSCTCNTFIFIDSLTLGQVDIIGPPPPARLDHAMCTVHLPTIPPTTTRDCELKESKLPTPPATAKGIMISHMPINYCTYTCKISYIKFQLGDRILEVLGYPPPPPPKQGLC